MNRFSLRVLPRRDLDRLSMFVCPSAFPLSFLFPHKSPIFLHRDYSSMQLSPDHSPLPGPFRGLPLPLSLTSFLLRIILSRPGPISTLIAFSSVFPQKSSLLPRLLRSTLFLSFPPFSPGTPFFRVFFPTWFLPSFHEINGRWSTNFVAPFFCAMELYSIFSVESSPRPFFPIPLAE